MIVRGLSSQSKEERSFLKKRTKKLLLMAASFWAPAFRVMTAPRLIRIVALAVGFISCSSQCPSALGQTVAAPVTKAGEGKLRPLGMSTLKICHTKPAGQKICETRFFTTGCYNDGNCRLYPFDPKTGKITGGPMYPNTEIEAAGELSVPPREERPPLSIVGKALICDNRRPDGPCWNLPEGENTYHNGDPVLPLTRLSNTKCPSPAVAGAPPCIPMARLRYCVEIKGCRILLTPATDLSPVPLPPVRYVKPAH